MSQKPKLPQITFNNGNAWFQLVTKGKAYTLRAKRFKYRIHEVKSKYLPKNKRIVVHVRFVEEVEICESASTTPPFLACQPINALDGYVKESGFDTVEAWLEALREFRIRIPEYPETRTLYLHAIEKP